jgi:hypothetical protein
MTMHEPNQDPNQPDSAATIPLLYTKYGNIPFDGLEAKHIWKFDETGIFFVEQYWRGDELVKESAHRFQYPPGTTLNLQQGGMNVGAAH